MNVVDIIKDLLIRVNKYSKKIRPITGSLPSPKDKRDYTISGAIPATLPKMVDLRAKFSPIKNQSPFNSCVGMALTSIVEYYNNIRTNELDYSNGWDCSDMQIWYDARKAQGWQGANTGCYIRDALNIAVKCGVSVEQAWPFIYSNMTKEPDTVARMFQTMNKVKKYYACLNEEEIKATLNRGHPVIFGMKIYQDFVDNGRKAGTSTYVWNKSNNQKYYGGHAMVIVGYNDDKKAFIVRNSWGILFGDKGYNYIDYKTLKNLSHDIYGVD